MKANAATSIITTTQWAKIHISKFTLHSHDKKYMYSDTNVCKSKYTFTLGQSQEYICTYVNILGYVFAFTCAPRCVKFTYRYVKVRMWIALKYNNFYLDFTKSLAHRYQSNFFWPSKPTLLGMPVKRYSYLARRYMSNGMIHIQRPFRKFELVLDKFWLVERCFLDTRSSEGRYIALWKVIVRWPSTVRCICFHWV